VTRFTVSERSDTIGHQWIQLSRTGAGKSLGLSPMVSDMFDSAHRFENLKFATSDRAVYGKSTVLIPSTVGACRTKGLGRAGTTLVLA
jgi:hypothetical protein